MNLRFRRLDEQQRRRSGRGGVQPDWYWGRSAPLANYGLGRKDNSAGAARTGKFAGRATNRANPCPRRGTPTSRKKDGELEDALQSLVIPETAGNPMSEQKWVRSSLRQLSQRLKALGQSVSPPTVGRLLRQLGYALRVNVKKQEASAAHPERNQQFEQIETQKQRFQAAGWPIISVDTKKKELIGNAQECWASLGTAARIRECA